MEYFTYAKIMVLAWLCWDHRTCPLWRSQAHYVLSLGSFKRGSILFFDASLHSRCPFAWNARVYVVSPSIQSTIHNQVGVSHLRCVRCLQVPPNIKDTVYPFDHLTPTQEWVDRLNKRPSSTSPHLDNASP